MTVTLIIGAVVAAALALLAVLWSRGRRRGSPHADTALADVLAELDARMERLAAEVSGTLGATRESERRARSLAELAGSIDLDEVLTRTLEAATNVPGVDAALVSVRGAGGEPVVAALGLSEAETDRAAIADEADGGRPRAVPLENVQDAEGQPLRTGLAVPLAVEADVLGQLAAYGRADDALGEAALEELEELAGRAAPAIDNARRYREARQLADLDALTGLHNRRYFHETLAREVARARRYERRLALIVLDLDDFKAINDRIGHLAGDGVLAEAAERLRDVVRSADVACRVGGDEFAIILPESAASDADGLYGRLQQALARRPLGQAGRLAVSAGVAELRPDDDAVVLFERADGALYEAKRAGKARVATAGEAPGA